MLESEQAIANADAIASVPGVDMLFIGTSDLSHQLGIHRQPEHPKIIAAYEHAAAACRSHGIWLGVAGIKGVPGRQPAGLPVLVAVVVFLAIEDDLLDVVVRRKPLLDDVAAFEVLELDLPVSAEVAARLLMPVEDDLRRLVITLMATRNEQVLFFAADDRLTYREVSTVLVNLMKDNPALNLVLLTKKQIGVEHRFGWPQLSELCLTASAPR